ncbi:MAG: hypothetical protein FJ012_01925 [Chloroflexi bacterium]|nr:hypothetical protein [Chloroflexota bacterium]
MHFFYERLKAAEAEGSEVAKRLLNECWFSLEGQSREAEEDQEGKISTQPAAEACCRRGISD